MKIMLLQPVYSIKYSESNIINIPLGVISLAAAIKKDGNEVIVKDLQREAFIRLRRMDGLLIGQLMLFWALLWMEKRIS